MKPILFHFEIFGIAFSLGSYRFFGFLAAALMIFIGFRILRKQGAGIVEISALTAAFSFVFLLGARLLNVILNYKTFLDHPLRVLEPAFRNFTMYGGFFAIFLLAFLLCRVKGYSFWNVSDAMAPWAAVSVAILKAGCFFNGCCYGVITDVPFGIRFPMGSPAYFAQLQREQIGFFSASLPVHPAQLYEIAVALIAALVSGWIGYKGKYAGNQFYRGLSAMVMVSILSAGRLIIFYFRDFPDANQMSNFIRGPVVLGGAALISAVWIIVRFIKYREMKFEKG